MRKLPDSGEKPGINAFRAITGALATVVVIAVVEVLARFNLHEGRVGAGQLALAAFSNVATLGCAVIALLAVGWLCGVVLGLPFRSLRCAIRGALMCVLPALAGAALVYRTQTFGLTVGLEHSLTHPAVSVLMGILVGLGIWRIGVSRTPTLMNLTRGLVLVVWLVCAGGTGLALLKTRDHVALWARADQPRAGEVVDQGPNLLLVVLDTLRADRVGEHDGKSLTPNLDRLAESSILYDQAISTAPWTLPVHASLLTGRYSDGHGVSWGHYKLDDDIPVLPELLKERGYETFAISNNHLLNEKNGFARGFDSFIQTTGDPTLNRWGLALRCGGLQTVATVFGLSEDTGWDKGSAWTNWLLSKRLVERGSSKRPFFAMLNYFEPHDPYLPPERFLQSHLTAEERQAARSLPQSEESLAAHACGLPDVYSDKQIQLLSRLYDAEVAYQDEIVGELIEMLRGLGLLKNTWLVVTSDHGELFGEWGMLFHTASSHYKLLHVPLLVRPPGGVEARRFAWPVQPVDVFVTLMEQAKAEVPKSVVRAYRLPLAETDVPQREVCVAQSHGASIAALSISQRLDMQADLTRWLRWVDSVYSDGYLMESDSRGRRTLFDVRSDPMMAENLADKRAEVLELLNGRFESWASGVSPRAATVADGLESEVSNEAHANAQVLDSSGGRPDDLPGSGK